MRSPEGNPQQDRHAEISGKSRQLIGPGDYNEYHGLPRDLKNARYVAQTLAALLGKLEDAVRENSELHDNQAAMILEYVINIERIHEDCQCNFESVALESRLAAVSISLTDDRRSVFDEINEACERWTLPFSQARACRCRDPERVPPPARLSENAILEPLGMVIRTPEEFMAEPCEIVFGADQLPLIGGLLLEINVKKAQTNWYSLRETLIKLPRTNWMRTSQRIDVEVAWIWEHRRGPHETRRTPEWNKDRGELRYQGRIVRQVKATASNVIMVLDTFEDDGWRFRIDDPLPDGPDPERLRDTVKSLNKGLTAIRFRSFGDGESICWEEDSRSDTGQ